MNTPFSRNPRWTICKPAPFWDIIRWKHDKDKDLKKRFCSLADLGGAIGTGSARAVSSRFGSSTTSLGFQLEGTSITVGNGTWSPGFHTGGIAGYSIAIPGLHLASVAVFQGQPLAWILTTLSKARSTIAIGNGSVIVCFRIPTSKSRIDTSRRISFACLKE